MFTLYPNRLEYATAAGVVKGVIAIGTDTQVDQLSHRECDDKPNAFGLTSGNTTMMMHALTADDRGAWMAAIMQAMVAAGGSDLQYDAIQNKQQQKQIEEEIEAAENFQTSAMEARSSALAEPARAASEAGASAEFAAASTPVSAGAIANASVSASATAHHREDTSVGAAAEAVRPDTAAAPVGSSGATTLETGAEADSDDEDLGSGSDHGSV